MAEVRWARKTMLLNMALMYSLVLFGGYVLWGNARIVFWIYVMTWIGILTIGRYYVCRPCRYYGQDCPSFGFSHLARILPKGQGKGFSRMAVIIDTSVIVASLLLPMTVWVIGIFSRVVPFDRTDHALMGAYLLLFVVMSKVHSVTGCGKCDIAECPMSKAAKESEQG